MKKHSLQWRMTLMTAALVTIACLLLHFFISRSAVMRIDEMGSSILRIEPVGDGSLIVGMDILDFYPDLPEQIQHTKDVFLLQSAAVTLAMILLGGACTYFLSGRALAPLRRFSAHMEKVQAQNLSEPLEVPHAEDEIARLTRSFNEMRKRLDAAFTAQRQFSANAAHELRTPLAVIQTNLDVLKKRPFLTPEEYADAFRMVSEQIGRLSQLVGVLLEMTELQTIQRTDIISLSALVEEVLCDLAQVADERNVALIQEPGEAVLTGSDSLLYRAVYNLVENAIKYNRPGGSVTLRVRTENQTAILLVADTGIGIVRENWERIFTPFFRVDKSRSRAMGGAGLGLALVRDIATLHGGSVQILQSSDRGTEVMLSLPIGILQMQAFAPEECRRASF